MLIILLFISTGITGQRIDITVLNTKSMLNIDSLGLLLFLAMPSIIFSYNYPKRKFIIFFLDQLKPNLNLYCSTLRASH